MVSLVARARLAVGLSIGVLQLEVMPTPAWAGSLAVSCGDLLPPVAAPAPIRDVTATDLLRLRDIGSPDAANPDVPSPLSVSPDGTMLAFVIMRADPVTNSYCRGLVVLPLRGAAVPRIVDRGGDYVMTQGFVRGLAIEVGPPRTITPVWSRDGRSLYYLKRLDGLTQVWRVDPTSGQARQLTHSAFDLETLVTDPATGTLWVSGRPGRSAAEGAIDEEARTGWLYDARVAPHSGARPKVREDAAPLELFTLDPVTGALDPAPPAARDRVAEVSADNAASRDVTQDGRVASIGPTSPALLGPNGIIIGHPAGPGIRCPFATCTGRIVALWWNRQGRTLVFARQQGWNGESSALYRWTPGQGAPTLILSTNDALQGCVKAAADLVCTNESASQPRHIVRVALSTGRIRTLFDPNSEFARLRLGTVRRLHWRNDRGLPAWGDLVLPPGYRPGTKLPMVVVQYRSRGFLRGGTSDEYPVYLFAGHGMAVLSLDVPPFVGVLDPALKTVADLERANFAGWAEQKSLMSSLRAGVAQAIATGAIDPARLGVTGLSNGATIARYALINSDLFTAAAISSCCLDPGTVMTYGGIAWADFNRSVGFPGATEQRPDFWAPVSLAHNAAKLDTPILMQLADEEYLLALEAFEALREHHKPVELYVFAGEHHGKWQPEHRLAIYERSIDWFDFWLQGRTHLSAASQARYERWEAMRLRRDQQRARSQASTSTSRRIR